MEDIKRMAAVLLVLILIIANLAFAVFTDLDDAEQRSLAEKSVPADNIPEVTSASAENAAVTGEVTAAESETEGEGDTSDVPAVTEAAGNANLKTRNTPKDKKEIIPAAEFSGEEEAQSVITIDGTLEGIVDKKVFHVKLPVQSSDVGYIADPQGLICKTQTAAYADSWFDPDSNVYFSHGEETASDGTVKTRYDGTSEPFTVVNKSSCAVAVVARVSASYKTSGAQVALASDNAWDSVTKPSIYLTAVRSDDFTDKTVIGRREQVITASVRGCPDAYCYRYNEDGTYSYDLMTDEELDSFRKSPSAAGKDTSFREFSIVFQGECNEEGDWKPDTDYIFPTVSVIWNVGLAPSAAPCVIEKNLSVALDTENIINYSFGALDSAADAITSAVYVTPEGVERDFRWNNYYLVFADDCITSTKEFASYVRERNGGVLRLKFNDPAKTTEEITLDLNQAPFLEENEITLEADYNKQLAVKYNSGYGDKAADGVAKITFGNTDLSSSVYSSSADGEITLNVIALRMIKDKKGGTVYVTFDDDAHTRCGLKIKIKE